MKTLQHLPKNLAQEDHFLQHHRHLTHLAFRLYSEIPDRKLRTSWRGFDGWRSRGGCWSPACRLLLRYTLPVTKETTTSGWCVSEYQKQPQPVRFYVVEHFCLNSIFNDCLFSPPLSFCGESYVQSNVTLTSPRSVIFPRFYLYFFPRRARGTDNTRAE